MIHLETLVTIQDKTLRELNDELYRQQRDMARLQARIDRLEAQVAKLQDPRDIAGNERPPHW